MKSRRSVWFGACLLIASWQTFAQTTPTAIDPYEEYGKHLRAAEEVTPLTSTLFGDQTSLYNGATEFDVTDIDIPGNSHLPVRLGRRLVVDDRRLDPGNLRGFGDWDVEVPYIDGTFVAGDGWTVLGASNTQSYARCSTTTGPYTYDASSGLTPPAYNVWDGDRLHIPGGVDEELLKNTESKLPAVADGKTYPWITKSFYRATCAASTANGYPGESFIVVAPNGDRYTFNWAQVNYMAPVAFAYTSQAGGNTTQHTASLRSHIFLLATEVDDRFGNWVKYAYNSAGQLTQISANDGRLISIAWVGNYISNATATDQVSGSSRTWAYGYSTTAGALPYKQGTTTVQTTINSLNVVTRPDNLTTRYTVTAGTLATVKPAPNNDPPGSLCQQDNDGNTGSMTYAVDSPTGAHGVFQFVYQRGNRKYVPLSCTNGQVNSAYPQVYDFFDNFALVSKQISGAGLTTQNWTYDYGQPGGGYVQATVPYPSNTETYIPQSATAYSGPNVVTVTGPTETTKYSFGINYGVDEGRLYKTETDAPNGTVMRTVTNTYVADSAIANQNFPGGFNYEVHHG